MKKEIKNIIKEKNKKVVHPFDAIYDKNSKIMFLDSVASVKSRDLGYQYASPQNRFWKVLSKLFNENNINNLNYKEFLLKNKIAL